MPGQEVEGATADEQNRESRDPESLDNPDEGTTMTPGGAMPAGGAMDHWATAMPNTDATKPETMPEGVGGTGETPANTDKTNPS